MLDINTAGLSSKIIHWRMTQPYFYQWSWCHVKEIRNGSNWDTCFMNILWIKFENILYFWAQVSLQMYNMSDPYGRFCVQRLENPVVGPLYRELRALFILCISKKNINITKHVELTLLKHFGNVAWFNIKITVLCTFHSELHRVQYFIDNPNFKPADVLIACIDVDLSCNILSTGNNKHASMLWTYSFMSSNSGCVLTKWSQSVPQTNDAADRLAD